MAAPMIELDHISKSFDGGRTYAVREVSLSAEAGAFVALVGGSGSGKTTTLKTINRLIEPDSGAVRVDGEAVEGSRRHALRRRIGYVFQEVGLFPHLSVAENIAITPKLIGLGQRADRRARRRTARPGGSAASLRRRRPSALSGGQRQRVGVARALAAKPQGDADGRALRRARSGHPRRARAANTASCTSGSG